MDLARALRDVYREPVVPERIDALKRDASNRSYHRLHFPGREPATLVAMELSGDPLRSEEAGAGDRPPELPFVNVARFLASRGIPVPTIHATDLESGILLLEDLGDETLERRLLARDPSEWEAHYRVALDLLLAFQEATNGHDAGCVGYSRTFDEALLRWELDHFREWGLDARRKTPVPPAARRALDAEFDRLARTIAGQPYRLVHRDYQSRNLMWTRRGLVLLDFQDALVGPRTYDLVALLCDSYVDVAPGLRDRLIALWAQAAGVPLDAARSEFHLVAVQRKLKDAGRFVFIDRVKGNPAFLPHVPHSLVLARRSLGESSGLARLSMLLEDLLND